MGKLLIFGAIFIIVAVVIVMWAYLLENRQTRFKMGLQGSKKRIAALEARNTQHVAVLEEIHEIADASSIVGDPMFDLIRRKAAEALQENKSGETQ